MLLFSANHYLLVGKSNWGAAMSKLAEQDDEIDLGELVCALFYRWWIVAFATILSVFGMGYYAFSAAIPEYNASVRFELLDKEQGIGSLGAASGLATLAGISLPNSISEADVLQDRILSRPFVASIYDRAGFKTDPEFNALLKAPSLLKRIMQFVLGASVEVDPTQNDYLVLAVLGLNERLSLSAADNGIIQLRISHPDALRASLLANMIVEQSLIDIFERERNTSRESLSYIAAELLQVRRDLDSANAAVRDYALNNSLQSVEELARTSSQLAQVRRDVGALNASVDALRAMGRPEFNGAEFAKNNPVATSLSFRRLLNLSNNPNDWVQPSEASIHAGITRLEAQRASLESSLNSLEARAIDSGAEALKLAALQREVEVQQAIYESVITQFEARSLFDGFEQASGRIIESAIPPSEPASPNKLMLLILGGVLGVFGGACGVLLYTFRVGLLHTRGALRSATGIDDVAALAKSQISGLDNSDLNKKQSAAMRDLLVSLPPTSKVNAVFASSTTSVSARLTLGLAKAAKESGSSVAIFDFTDSSVFQPLETSSVGFDGPIKNVKIADGVDLLKVENPGKLLNRGFAQEMVEKLRKSHDKVCLLFPSPRFGVAHARIFSTFIEGAVLVTECGKVKRADLESISTTVSKSNAADPILVVV